MPGVYPYYHSLVEKLAAKIITRVVSDGVGVSDAIKEAVKYGSLDNQQVIHMLAILQDYNMVYNGDAKNYFYSPDDLGKGIPNTPNGYVVYAGKKENEMDRVFSAVENFRKAGFSDEQLVEINPELDEVIQIMQEMERKYVDIMNQSDATDVGGEAVQFPPQQQQAPVQEPQLEMAATDAISFRKISQAAPPPPADVEVEEADEDAIKDILSDDEVPVSEPQEGGEVLEDVPADDLGGDEASGGGDTVTLTKGPDYFNERIESAPEWNVENILSIEKTRNYLENLNKELEEVAFNDNIQIEGDLLTNFDNARSSIQEQLSKIKDAQKQTEKLEDKQDDIEQEFEGDEVAEGLPEDDLGAEAPTESLINKAPKEGPEIPEDPLPAPAPVR